MKIAVRRYQKQDNRQSKAVRAALSAKNILNTDGHKNGKTFINIEFWQLVGFLLSFLGICFTFGKMLLAQFREQQDERQKQQERLQGKVEIMENKLAEFNAGLPLTYVLREDYIRNQVVLEAKLDNVAEKLTEIYKMESVKK